MTAGTEASTRAADEPTGSPTAGMWVNVAVYVVVVFAAAVGLVVLQPVLGIPGVVIEIVQFAPSVAVLAVFLVRLRSPERRRAIQLSQRMPAGSWARLGIAVLGVLVILALTVAFHLAAGRRLAVTSPADVGAPFLLVLVAQFVGACGEEAGWRCYLQPQLEQRFSVVVSGVLVGLVWSVWHVQVFGQGLAFAGAFVLSGVSLSVILGCLLQRVRQGRLLVAGGFHLLVNLGLLLLMREESGSVVEELSVAVPCLVLAVVAACWTVGRRGVRR